MEGNGTARMLRHMTRENKLALVVGFGLILFVGILISDHFSVVRSQTPANLTMQLQDPLAAVNTTTFEQASLIEIKPLRTEPLPEAQPGHDGLQVASADGALGGGAYEHSNLQTSVFDGSPPPNPGGPHISMGFTARPGDQPIPEGFERANPSKANTAAFQFHDVQSGDSMFSIAKQYYGTTEAIEDLARFNKLDDASEIRTGQRIRIPSAQELGLASAQTATTESIGTGTVRPSALKISGESSTVTKAKETSKPRVTYTVRKGETLRVIALKVMGSKNKWNKIYNLNRDVIDDPDDLKVGTVLRLS